MIRQLLAIISVFNIGFGLWAMFDPLHAMEWMLNWQNSATPDGGAIQPATIGEFRAIFGGLILALGMVTLRCLWSPSYAAWLQPLAWCYLGLALARLSSLLLDGISNYTMICASVEVAAAWMLGVHAQRMQAFAEEEELEEEELEEY